MNTNDVLHVTRRSRIPRVYIIWLTVSAALHGALFAGWSTAPQPRVAATARIDLELEAPHPGEPSVQKISLPNRSVRNVRSLRNNHHPAPSPSVAADRNAADDSTPSPVTPQAEPQEIPETPISALGDRNLATGNIPESTQVRSDPSLVQSEVWLRFEKAKTYPLLALRYGWEGHLLLGYQVDATGFINNVHVARSSGNAVLDQSAVRTLNQVGRLPTSIWRGGPVLDLQLPVIYKLTQS